MRGGLTKLAWFDGSEPETAARTFVGMASLALTASHDRTYGDIAMTDPRRRTLAAATLGVAGCLLLVACGGTTAAGGASTPVGQVTPAATDPASTAPAPSAAAPTDPASAAPTPAAAGGTDACSLVTQEDVSAVLGKDPGAGKSFSSHGASQCQYGEMQTTFVLVNLTPTLGQSAYDLMHKRPKISEAGVVADVPGLGDRAFEISGHGTASIYVDKGDSMVLVMVEIRSAATPPSKQVLALATTAAGRL